MGILLLTITTAIKFVTVIILTNTTAAIIYIILTSILIRYRVHLSQGDNKPIYSPLGFIDRHDLITNLIGGCVERNCQPGHALLIEPQHLVDKPGSGNGHLEKYLHKNFERFAFIYVFLKL